jgi:hypothetical protein
MAGRAAGEGPAVASLPFLTTPHDNLRCGLPALKADAQLVHPVQAIQQNVRARRARHPAARLRSGHARLLGCAHAPRGALGLLSPSACARVQPRADAPAPSRARAAPQRTQVTSAVAMQTNLYGSAFPARAAIERQILGRRVASSVVVCRVTTARSSQRALEAHASLPPARHAQNAAPAGLRHPLRAPGPRHPQRCVAFRAARARVP